MKDSLACSVESSTPLTQADIAHLEDLPYRIEDTGYKTPCWLWKKPGAGGYGPHRKFYALYREGVRPQRVLHHQCEVRACVNPYHLLMTTPAGNSQASSWTVINMDIAREMRRMWKAGGLRQREIAEHFGVGLHIVAGVVSNAQWKEPAEPDVARREHRERSKG